MAKAKRRMVEANDRAVMRTIVARIKGNFAEGPDLALAPVDLADDLAAYAAETEQPATPEPPEVAQHVPDTALVAEVPVPQPDLPVPEPNPEPPRQTAAPLMSLTEAITQAGQGNRRARVVRPRMRRR